MRHIESVKKTVLFTDIKDFTLKNSLLTQLQVRNYLSKQDWLVLPITKRYGWKLVKTIWDSYMLIFDEVEDALNTAIQIQKKLKTYNSKINYNLYKYELRITISYWNLLKEQTLLWEDYFWDTVNIASRLQYSVVENKIYATKEVIDQIKDKKKYEYEYIWKTSLRWVLQEIWIYEVFYDEESKSDFKNLKIFYYDDDILITENLMNTINKVSNMIVEFSLMTAMAWMLFAWYSFWMYIMIIFHLILAQKIALSYNINIFSRKETEKIIMTILVSILWITVIQLFKISVLTVPITQFGNYLIFTLCFWFSYLIWKNLNRHFYTQSQRIENTNKDLKKMLTNNYEKKKKVYNVA